MWECVRWGGDGTRLARHAGRCQERRRVVGRVSSVSEGSLRAEGGVTLARARGDVASRRRLLTGEVGGIESVYSAFLCVQEDGT
jgi:hypothetical protein